MPDSNRNPAVDTGSDFTEIRRQEALPRTGSRQSAIINRANFSSIATDAKGVIQIFKVGVERMLGYSADDAMSKFTPADTANITSRRLHYPHGYCLTWNPALLWTTAMSDATARN